MRAIPYKKPALANQLCIYPQFSTLPCFALFDVGEFLFVCHEIKTIGKKSSTSIKKDIDFSLVLYELMPDGKYFYLSYFMGRASYAKDVSKRQLLKPRKIETISFTNTYITSKKISKGSRIVIVLNVNKSPDEQINYGTGKDVSDESIKDAKSPLDIKWYNHSYIQIPVWKN